ncbi:MAG: type I-MYXAN CRISPR-associated protein Cas6/Cmx6 [bacterium]
MPFVDLSFPLRGTTVPVDHGYALFSAVNRLIPAVHGHSKLAIHPIRGVYAGGGILQLSKSSRLTIRLEADEIKTCLPLAGKTLVIQGVTLQVGVPRVYLLTPAANLRARLVTIKGFLEEAAFREAALRQLDDLHIQAELKLGPRRTVRIQDKRIVGYPAALLGLTAEESLTIQEHGLGGRRRFGCGVFVRVREKKS